MESEGLLQHYVKTEVFTAYICNNSYSAIDCFMVGLHFHKIQFPDPPLRQENIFCFINVLHNKVAELDVHGSVRRNRKLIERTNKMQPCSRIYYSSVSLLLNMFRATHRPSSGAQKL